MLSCSLTPNNGAGQLIGRQTVIKQINSRNGIAKTFSGQREGFRIP